MILRKVCTALGLLLFTVGCSDDGSGDDPTGGSGGQTTKGGSGGTAAGAVGQSGSATGGTAGEGSGNGGTASGGAASGGAAGEASSLVGVCGQRGESTVTATTFEGFEEFYLISEEGFGEDICVVRFDVARAGEGPAGCVDGESAPCVWSHLVQLSNPTVVTDEDGVCASSDLALDEAAIAELDGSEAAYGFVSEYAGHNSVLLKHDPTSETWDPFGSATWDEETGSFRFERPDRFCDY
ncbi:MAG TPA: hypothetical protein VEX18_10210 [Polyangiaceae bacterium]|nr:hypothetical protein [Polyangiaceae bacterium]